MATWQDLVGFVNSNYKVADQREGWLKLLFDTGNLRSQIVFVSIAELDDGAESWALIQSPFAKAGTVHLPQVLEYLGDVVCGGVAQIGDLLTIRHAVPLANLNINEFERPLHLVTLAADAVEKRFVGGDAF